MTRRQFVRSTDLVSVGLHVHRPLMGVSVLFSLLPKVSRDVSVDDRLDEGYALRGKCQAGHLYLTDTPNRAALSFSQSMTRTITSPLNVRHPAQGYPRGARESVEVDCRSPSLPMGPGHL